MFERKVTSIEREKIMKGGFVVTSRQWASSWMFGLIRRKIDAEKMQEERGREKMEDKTKCLFNQERKN